MYMFLSVPCYNGLNFPFHHNSWIFDIFLILPSIKQWHRNQNGIKKLVDFLILHAVGRKFKGGEVVLAGSRAKKYNSRGTKYEHLPTSYPGHFASGQRKWPWHRPVTWPQNLQHLGCSIMIIYAYKYVYRIVIHIVITDRSKQTQCCVYNQRESNKISWLCSVFVVHTSFSNIARNIDDF
jgi:hypothetical protein